MPNPVVVQCPRDTWTLIGTDQVFGYIYPADTKPIKYLYTYRLTGEAAPTTLYGAIPIFQTEEKKLIISGVGIDIYIMAIGNDGAVRYDWWW
jgi:hypothetical protein